MVLALVADVLFRTKVEAAARQARVPLLSVSDAAQAVARLEGALPELVLIDLSLPNAVDDARALRAHAPRARLVAFGSHVDAERLAQAREAGCDAVLARSAFVRALPALIAGIIPA